MNKYALNMLVALLAFACGVYFFNALGGSAGFWSSRFETLIFISLTLAPSAVCFTQAFPGNRGLRQSATYNLLMLSLSGLTFIVGASLLLGMLIFG